MTELNKDVYWMRHALSLAQRAEREGEVPIGAVVVQDNHIIGDGWNQPIQLDDPTAHAEIIAIRHSAKTIRNYRLNSSTLYVTLEPCMMCVGAILYARIERLVFGASDQRAGAVQSVFQLIDTPGVMHKMQWQGGILSDACAQLLKDFFKVKRLYR